MRCNEFLEHLNQYIDNDLPEDKRRECQEHLSQCERCKNAFEEEKEINKMFIEVMNQDDIAFESRIDNVMATIDKEKYTKEAKTSKVVNINSRKKSRFFNKKIAGLAAVCAICIYLAPGALQSMQRSSKDMAATESKANNFSEKMNVNEMRISGIDNKSVDKTSYVTGEGEPTNVEGGDVMSAGTYGINKNNRNVDEGKTTKEVEEKIGIEVKEDNTVYTDSKEEPEENTSDSDQVEDKTVIPEKTTVPVKGEYFGETAVPGKDADKNKLIEMLDKDAYILNNFGLKVVINNDKSYIDNNGKQQSFEMKFGMIEMFVEDDDFVYIIYRGTKKSDEKIVSKVLKFDKASKEMKEIYEINTPEIIESLKIEDDGLVYIIRYKNKIKSTKIEK